MTADRRASPTARALNSEIGFIIAHPGVPPVRHAGQRKVEAIRRQAAAAMSEGSVRIGALIAERAHVKKVGPSWLQDVSCYAIVGWEERPTPPPTTVLAALPSSRGRVLALARGRSESLVLVAFCVSERRAAENDPLVRSLLQHLPHGRGKRAHVLDVRLKRAAE
eukprot:1510435-Prymnesium_polylepis.1